MQGMLTSHAAANQKRLLCYNGQIISGGLEYDECV
jgi:hypothetical protein